MPVVARSKHGDGQRKQAREERVAKVKRKARSGVRLNVVAGTKNVVDMFITYGLLGVDSSGVMVDVAFAASRAAVQACVWGEERKVVVNVTAGLAALLQTVLVTRQARRGASWISEQKTV